MSRLDALLAAIAPARRAALYEQAERPRETVGAWISREGRDAGWVLVQWCRDRLGQLPRYGFIDARQMLIVTRFRELVAALRSEPEVPAVWIELLAAVPAHKPPIARGLVDALPDDPATFAAIRRGLATLEIPSRRLLAIRLRRSGALAPELAVTWFADPTLRPLAEEYFTPGVEDHEQLLRDRLAGAKQGEREAIVRVLRRIDPKLALSGTHDTSTDGELQARLREQPLDEVSAEVWADSLIDRQDPRGEVIALELAIRRTDDPERALELSRAQGTLVATHRKALWNRPGGFPFREKFRGRGAIAFTSDWDHTMRGKLENLVDRVQAFVETCTDVRAPRDVIVGRRHVAALKLRALDEAPASLQRMVAALGADAVVLADAHGAAIRRTQVREPIADLDAFRAALLEDPDHSIAYEFQLAWPNTGVALPHQEGEHYAGGEPLRSRLQLHLQFRSLDLRLAFPFESEADPRFLELYEAICETLGRVMTPSRWSRLTSSADGKKLVAKRFRFAGDPGAPAVRTMDT